MNNELKQAEELMQRVCGDGHWLFKTDLRDADAYCANIESGSGRIQLSVFAATPLAAASCACEWYLHAKHGKQLMEAAEHAHEHMGKLTHIEPDGACATVDVRSKIRQALAPFAALKDTNPCPPPNS